MDEIVAALDDPHRRQLLDILREGEQPVGELVAALGLSQPGVSKHLRVLRTAGLVAVRADGQRRLYRLRPEPLALIDAWLAPYRAYWPPVLDALESRLDATPDHPWEMHMDDATLVTRDGQPVLVFERLLPHSPAKVWHAVTDATELRHWFPARITGGRSPGAPLRFTFGDDNGDALAGEVVAFDPPTRFAFTWEMS